MDKATKEGFEVEGRRRVRENRGFGSTIWENLTLSEEAQTAINRGSRDERNRMNLEKSRREHPA